MTSGSPYPSPSEERAGKKKRSGGLGFYADRGREYLYDRTEQRDRRRRPVDREVAQLGRILAKAAKEFPRFRKKLNQWQHHVLVQLRSPEWKAREVLSCLTADPLSIEEIVEETWLDEISVEETLKALVAEGVARRCNRDGEPVRIRRDGKPAMKVYWCRSDNRKSI